MKEYTFILISAIITTILMINRKCLAAGVAYSVFLIRTMGFCVIFITRGGRKRLSKFKFSAKFPIGLHVILQLQIKKFENDCYLM